MNRKCALLTSVLVLGLAASALASEFTSNLQDLQNAKALNWSSSSSPNPPEGQIGGDNIGSAVPIALGDCDSGNTCGFTDDYDEVCPFTGSTSPDVVYRYSPTASGFITISLCNSGYDTKVYVYENSAGALMCCNDDACSDPTGNPYRSLIECCPVTGGNTYYIVVDGYFGDCGDYEICVSACESPPSPCDPENCPPGALLEGEPICGAGYVDTYNGGCNSTPPSFSTLPCQDGLTVCGEGGTYVTGGLSYRDTDWYSVPLPAGTPCCNITATLCASFDSQLAILDSDCGFITLLCGSAFGVAGQTVSCGPVISCEEVWIFVGTSSFAGVPCGSPYVLTLDIKNDQGSSCCGLNAVESKTWGGIKALYR